MNAQRKVALPIFLEGYDFIAALDEWILKKCGSVEKPRWELSSYKENAILCSLEWVINSQHGKIGKVATTAEEAVFIAIEAFDMWNKEYGPESSR